MTAVAEYRKDIELDADTEYTYVEMGPVPELPSWHEQANPSRFPFPTEPGAWEFAKRHKKHHPGREIVVATTDGQRFVL